MAIMSQDDMESLKLHRRIRTGLIARLNDEFRMSSDNDALVMLTVQVAELAESESIMQVVRDFDRFDEPHSEHDVGHFGWQGERLVWKIDCYDYNGVWVSWVDPQSKDCVRGLTVMRADEY